MNSHTATQTTEASQFKVGDRVAFPYYRAHRTSGGCSQAQVTVWRHSYELERQAGTIAAIAHPGYFPEMSKLFIIRPDDPKTTPPHCFSTQLEPLPCPAH